MAEGCDRQLWGHTSCVLAMLFNTHRDPKKSRARGADEFNPYVRRAGKAKRGIPIRRDNIRILKALLRTGGKDK